MARCVGDSTLRLSRGNEYAGITVYLRKLLASISIWEECLEDTFLIDDVVIECGLQYSRKAILLSYSCNMYDARA